jgi:hypothetical protein
MLTANKSHSIHGKMCSVSKIMFSRTFRELRLDSPADIFPSRGHVSPSISPSHSIKNTGHLAQCFLVLGSVRVETLPQYMEALRANCGVHASGLSRTEAGIYPAPTLPLTRTWLTINQPLALMQLIQNPD